jgi:hypothetical protein
MPTKENVLTRTDDFIKWFLPKIEKFPRNYKFLFGDRLVEIQLDLLENLIEAYYRKEKLTNLRAANIGVEKLRHLLQISTEMRFLSFDHLRRQTAHGDCHTSWRCRGGARRRGRYGARDDAGYSWTQSYSVNLHHCTRRNRVGGICQGSITGRRDPPYISVSESGGVDRENGRLCLGHRHVGWLRLGLWTDDLQLLFRIGVQSKWDLRVDLVCTYSDQRHAASSE